MPESPPPADPERSYDLTRERARVPFFDLLSLDIVALEHGSATCRMPYGDWLTGLGELGIPAGIVALADCSLAYAASSVGTEGTAAVSVSLHLDYRQPAPPLGMPIEAASRAWQLDHGFAYGEGTVTGGGGGLLATTSLRSLALPTVRMGYVGGAAGSTASPPAQPTVPPVAAPVDDAAPGTGSSPELDALLATPLARRCDLRVDALGDGSAQLEATPPPEFLRSQGVVHGGAVGLVAHLAMAAALRWTSPAGEPPRRLDLHLDYLRPAPVGRPLRLRSKVVHRSRRLAVVTAEIVGEDGRPVALGRETCILPA